MNDTTMAPFGAKRALILAPHTDDAELGCGGTWSRLQRTGCDVHVAVYSCARASVPQGADEETMLKEFYVAAEGMGTSRDNTHFFDFPVRYFPRDRQEILEKTVRLVRSLNPDLVLMPSQNDIHQDHHVIYEEGLRASKERIVAGYELAHNLINFTASAFVLLEEQDIAAKLRALDAYESQSKLGRAYFSEEMVRGQARLRGAQMKAHYAEAFELYRYRT